MRLATYNVENLFDRAKALNLETWEEGRPVLEDFTTLNKLLGDRVYTTAAKEEMVRLMTKLGMEKSDTGPFVLVRRSRGALLKRPSGGGIEITASGRADWIGSLELRDEPIRETPMRNTARVIADVAADVLGVVEAESRPVLVAFNDELLANMGSTPFRHVMVIDGNDSRGIDVGLMTVEGYSIGTMRSHVDDQLPGGGAIFSRDCPEYTVTTPSGARLIVLVNHLKSKGYGDKRKSDERRREQARRVKAIYEGLVAAGEEFIAVIGDFNDTPSSAALAPLIKETNLKDAFLHPRFDDGGYPGTYGLCNAANKIDYLLLAPKLFERVTAGGVFRKGMWPGARPKRWDSYPEVARPADAASDHAAIWVDVDL